MNGLIIVNQHLGHNEHKVRRLKEEFAKLNVRLDVFVNDGSLAVIRNNRIHIKLPKADFVIYLDKDIYLAKQLEKAGYRLFDKPDFIKLCDDKMLTNIYAANRDIKTPKTISGPLFYDGRPKKENLTFLNGVMYDLGMPLVVKRVYGSLGMGVFLAETKEQLIKIYKKYCHEPIQFQEYIKESYGRSMRVIVIDQKVVGGFIRFNKCDFRSNYGPNASAKKARNCDKFFDFAEKIAKEFKIEYAGIDILFGYNNEPVLCEINSNAFFEEFEKVTKINVAKKLAKYIVKKVKEENEQK